ncbi:hypothetical protein JYU34_004330 [Plutella xylostella]|uniref:FLYWCH-type domain-containing protein n=1 Tax=Plutella xylostella TaxID=51655 RepID=A0ABQ7QXR1_PLUXY|nr:hypothetical protein JYU34_004330 [Plutella xylostella]
MQSLREVSFIHYAHKGSPMLLYKGYTYSKHLSLRDGDRYRCSSNKSMKCRCYLILDKDGKVVHKEQFDHKHTHEPPTLHATSDGKYYKI